MSLPIKLNQRTLAVAAGVGALLVLILWQVGAFSFGKIPPGRTMLPASAITGTPIVVVASQVPVTYRAVGTVTSRSLVEVAPRIVARVRELPVRAGDKVKKGDVLAKLDEADLAAAARQASARLNAAQSGVKAAESQIQQAQAAFDLASVEVARIRQLAAAGTMSQQALDAAEAKYRSARAALDQASETKAGATADSSAAGDAVRQADAVAGYAVIVSPMDGVVAERLADPGDLASPGNILLRLFDPSRLMIEVPVREGLVSRIKLGERVPFTVEALGTTLQGEVKEIVPAVDPGSRTFIVRICIGEVAGLMPGMFGVLELPMGTRPAIVLPHDAVHRVGQLEYVTTKIGDRAARTLVRTIPAGSNQCEVVAGLAAGVAVFRH